MREHNVRPSVCADDRWYPRDAAHLRQWLDQFLANVPAHALDGELIALISPHAGYAFSGQTAAHAYKRFDGKSYRRVIVIGPSHFADYGAQAVNASHFYETPLGRIEVDEEAVAELDRRIGLNFVRYDREHSLEMQLPFLQRMLGAFKLVPIMMSYPFYIVGIRARNACENLSAALAPMLDEQTILIASSDLSHLHDYESVQYFDRQLEMYVQAYDIPGLIDFMSNEDHEARACGDTAIVTAMMAAKARGANRVAILHRTNSGDVTGMRAPGQYTVGYMAAAIYREDAATHE